MRQVGMFLILTVAAATGLSVLFGGAANDRRVSSSESERFVDPDTDTDELPGTPGSISALQEPATSASNMGSPGSMGATANARTPDEGTVAASGRLGSTDATRRSAAEAGSTVARTTTTTVGVPIAAGTANQKEIKDAYEKQVEAKLDELEARREALQAIADASPNEKSQIEAQISQLDAERDAIRQQFDELKGMDVNVWQAQRAQLDRSLDELAQRFEQSEQQYGQIAAANEDAEEQLKEAYQKRVEAKLNQLDAKHEELQAQADGSPEAQAQFQSMASQLEAEREQVRSGLDQLKSADLDNWENMRAELDQQIDSLAKDYDQAGARFQY